MRRIVGVVAVRNPVGLPGTIPDELIDAAKALVVIGYLGEADLEVSDTRQRNAKTAEATLEMVASGKMRIVPPENYAPVQAEAPSPSVGKRHNQFRPGNLDGV